MMADLTEQDLSFRAIEFERLRPRLMGIAYRMLQTRHEAEDVVQDAWLRLARADEVNSVEGMLVTTVTRLCLDVLKSARVRHEQYVGPWLPEPLRLSEESGASVEMLDAISLAMLHLIDRLEPTERAVFLLHEVFDYPYREVAAIVGKTEANCRQIGHRARVAVRSDPAAQPAAGAEHGRLLQAFLSAAQEGDLQGLEALLTNDAELLSDGGGKAAAARNPIRGPNAIARFMAGIAAKSPEGAVLTFENLNGYPAAVVSAGGRPVVAMALEIRGDRVARVFAIRNPDKLGAASANAVPVRLI